MILEVRNLSKRYGEVLALNDFSFAFQQGIYGLLGPNGAGKSTLMKILTQNIPGDSGEIFFMGSRIVGYQKNYIGSIGYMPQQQRLYDTFTGVRFLYYMAALKNVSKDVARKQIPELLRRVNLVNESRRQIHTYSGGMKQRLLIAQALLGNPSILLMDEPTAGLDPKERVHIRNLISEIAQEKVVLIATHVVPDIEHVSREILLMDKGHLVCSGTTKELTADISGKVIEIRIPKEQLESVIKKYRVVAVAPEDDMLRLRVLWDVESPTIPHTVVEPTLEDVYLYHFGDEA